MGNREVDCDRDWESDAGREEEGDDDVDGVNFENSSFVTGCEEDAAAAAADEEEEGEEEAGVEADALRRWSKLPGASSLTSSCLRDAFTPSDRDERRLERDCPASRGSKTHER